MPVRPDPRPDAPNLAGFIRKWARFTGKESAAYQEHFSDLCRVLGEAPPVEADPSGTDFFCFQKRVLKDAELVDPDLGGPGVPQERGFADVWKKGCFAWEYKGKKKNLDEAYQQLLRYREALLNPPLLVVCDFDRYLIRTNFNGTVQEIHEFSNAELDRPENLRILRAVFADPEFLRPQRTTAEVTELLAKKIGAVALSLQARESRELADAHSRAELKVAQRRNLRIARFLNRFVFCFFAEDTGLLPKHLFTDLLKSGFDDLGHFAESLENLFGVMAKGGSFGKDKIRHFNGHLFEESTVFELTEEELRALAEAGEADWQFIEPSIMGTLFERALGDQRAQLGAHYTGETDILTLLEPVLMAPLRREWAGLQAEMVPVRARGRGTPAHRQKLLTFQKRLAEITVLDPACGSGNFLYVSLKLLLGLEKEIISYAAQLGFVLPGRVSAQQLAAIEINPYAFELAQVSVQIGFLQWRRDNGFDNDRTPILQSLDGFQNEDALLVPHFRSKAKTLKDAQNIEHQADNALKFYTEREWPACDVIVGNPPFLGGKLLRRELGDGYVNALFDVYAGSVRPEADLCCYWFEKARQAIAAKRTKRAGLLATQGIRGGANGATLQRIKETGDIFFAESDRPWVLAGATVHVSMVGFDDATEQTRILNGKEVAAIGPRLSLLPNLHLAEHLAANEGISFMGITPAGPFDLPFSDIENWLAAPNPNGRPNSDVLRLYLNGQDINQRARWAWTVDFGVARTAEEAAQYELPFEYLRTVVAPVRAQNRRQAYARNWWLYAEPRPAMRQAFVGKSRFLATCMVAKHRTFSWLDAVCLPANVVIAFGRADNYFFGLLNSRCHLLWAQAHGTQLREKESGSRYTPTTCFETFPLPCPTPAQESSIAAAAGALNDARESWLNPPEWTETRILEFPGSADGPWRDYLAPGSVAAKTGVGKVRFPSLAPRDSDCSAKLKDRSLTNLYTQHPAWLEFARRRLDAAVAAAYGWPAELADEEILQRLLSLNHERAAAEARSNAEKRGPQRLKDSLELI